MHVRREFLFYHVVCKLTQVIAVDVPQSFRNVQHELPDLGLGEELVGIPVLLYSVGEAPAVAVLVLDDHVVVLLPSRVVPDDVLVFTEHRVSEYLVLGVLRHYAAREGLYAFLDRVETTVEPVNALEDRAKLATTQKLELDKLLVIPRYVRLFEGYPLRRLFYLFVGLVGVN